MPGPVPKQPTGTDPQSRFMAWVWETLQALRPQDTPTALVSRTTRGWAHVPRPPGPGGITVGLYRFKSMQGDYLVCRSWDGTNEGTTDINIAKPAELRASVATETLRGVLMTYSAYDNSLNGQTRHATDGQNPETQYVTPPYALNCLLWAVPAATLVNITTGAPPVTKAVALLDLNISSRAWAAF